MPKKKLGWYRSGGFEFDPFLTKEDKSYFEKQLWKAKKKDYILDKEAVSMLRLREKKVKTSAKREDKAWRKKERKRKQRELREAKREDKNSRKQSRKANKDFW